MIQDLDIGVKVLVEDLFDTMKDLGVELGDNTQKLALLDAESADKYIGELEDRVEDLEWAADDYYQIDKDQFEEYLQKLLEDEDMDDDEATDVVEAMKTFMDLNNKNKDV